MFGPFVPPIAFAPPIAIPLLLCGPPIGRTSLSRIGRRRFVRRLVSLSLEEAEEAEEGEEGEEAEEAEEGDAGPWRS